MFFRNGLLGSINEFCATDVYSGVNYCAKILIVDSTSEHAKAFVELIIGWLNENKN